MAKSKFIFSTGLESREGKLSFDDSTGNLTLTGSTVFSGSVKAHYTPSANEDLVTVEYLNDQISANDQLGELNDVTISTGSLDDGHMLVYNTDVWENVAMSGDATMAADGAITISNDAVETAMIKDANVTNAKLALNAVTNAKIQDGTIANAKLAYSSITVTAGNGLSTTDADLALGESATLSVNVDDSSIAIDSDALQIKASGVTTAKIADLAVTTAKLSGSSVTNAKIANDAVNGDKIADDSIDSEHIVNGSVDNAHLAGDIASSKLAELSGSFDTDDLLEGSNLYFTDARAQAAITVTDAGGDGSLAYSNGEITYTGPSAAETREHFSAGGDLAYNSSSGEFSFTERTDAEVKELISVTNAGGDGSLAYNSSSGVFTYTGPSAAEVRARFSAGTGVSLTEGEIAIGQAVATDSNVQFNNMTVDGNLIVNGDQFKIDGETVVMDDTLMEMGTVDKAAPTEATNKDLGLVMHRHDGSDASLVAMYWDQSESKFKMQTGVEENSGILASGSAATLEANLEGDVTGDVTGDLTGNADTASQLETARTLSISGDAAGSATFDGSANADIEITIGNDAVERSMILNDAVNGDKIADNSIDSDHIVDGAVDNVHLAGGIASSKLAELSGSFSADSLPEAASNPTNKYFTDARAREAISVDDVSGDGSLAYNNSTGVISYTGPSAAEVRAHFDAENGVSLSSGTSSLDLNSLSATAVSNTSDSFAFIDSDDNSTKKATIASVISGSAGSGLVFDAATATLKLDTSGDGAVGEIVGTTNEVSVAAIAGTNRVQIGLTDNVAVSGTLSAGGNASLGGDLTVAGDLFVQGTTVSVDSTEVKIVDRTLVIASGSSNAEIETAGGAGLKIGSEDAALASILYDGSGSFDVTDHMNLASGQEFRINNASILSADTLGSSVVNSSLTSVGTITSGEWNGTVIANAYLADNAVSTAKIQNLAVTTAKLSGSSVTNAKLADNAVSTDKIQASAVTNAKLANDSVTVTAGNGLSTTAAEIDLGQSAELSVNVDNSSIEIDSDTLQIKASGVTNDMLEGSIAAGKLAGSIPSSKLAELSGSFDTDSLPEGSNLYHTEERVQDITAGQLVTNGSHVGISFVYDDAGDGAIDATVDVANILSGGTGVTILNSTASIGQDVATTSNVTFNNMTADGNLVVGGNLTVNGDQFKIDGETVVMDDTLMEMGTVDKAAPIEATTKDLGLVMHRHDGSDASLVAMYWDQSDTKFRMQTGVEENNGVLASGSTATLVAELEGNADTASQLETARDFSMTGDVAAAAVSFDGSGNIQLTAVIQDDAVENSMIKADAVDSDQIADGAVDNAHLAGGIEAGKLAGSIPSSKLAELSGSFDTDDLLEGSNLYFTDARAQNAITVTDAGGDGSLAYSGGTLTYTGPSAAETRLHFSVDDVSGDGSLAYNSTSGVFTYTGPSAAEVRAHFTGGTGVSISEGTASIGQAVATTDDVSFNKVTVSGSAGEHVISMHQASLVVKEVASMNSGSVVDSIAASNGVSAEYLISVKDASGKVQTNKLLLGSDGTDAYVVEYGDLDTAGASGFVEFTADVDSNNARLLINSNSSGGAVTVRFHKTEIAF